MNPVLRTLEEWTTHQDYLWFLALLAWGGVLAAEYRRKEHRAGVAVNGWLIALAASYMIGALLELLLLAQDLKMPYTRLDAAMGVAQTSAAAALVWAATATMKSRLAWRAMGLAMLASLTLARVTLPIEAGVALALIQAGAVLALWRGPSRRLPMRAAVLLLLMPVIATHGPLAYAMREGRRETDWSHFALVAAAASLLAGISFATAAWRRRIGQAAPDEAASETLRRDVRRAVWVLAVWLSGGVLLAVWYGRMARRAFEENLLRRVETAVLALDQDAVAEALGPDLHIASIEQRRYSTGRPVWVATVPHTRAPVYATLRTQMARVRTKNPDFQYLYITTWRDGHLLVLNSLPRTRDAITHVIHHDVSPADLERIAAGASFLEGPVTSESWVPQFSAKAPLRHPVSNRLLGWLVADVDATRWMTTFRQARLQTMALVGAGVGLWALAVAYRLRREGRDIAEQRAAEAAAADRMKSAFLAKVSHELRTPIQSILGYGELLESAPLAEQHRGWLAALRSHGDIMLRLVNDLIDLGALQSGAFRLEPAAVSLHALIHECAAALRPAANAKGLSFQIDVAPNVPAWVRVDGVRLRQILLNLLMNAVKFTSVGGVRLDVHRGSDGRTEFVVSDTGPGIAPSLRSRLFQPFARLDPASGGGSGLGLALVQGLCAVMGGEVNLSDDTSRGTTFVVRLPLARCETPKGEAAAESATPTFAGIRVLVAEDNSLVREMLVAFLTENGADVITAEDGVTALESAERNAVDVLLLDIALPRMDGIAVAKALRRKNRVKLRIIGLSAHVTSQDEARAREAGMNEFLTKPVRLAQLAAVINSQMRGSSGSAPIGERITDETLRAKLVAQFNTETPRLFSEMRQALKNADWPRLRSGAHYLKNSADVLGMTELQLACQRLATLDERDASAAAPRLLEEIEAAMPTQFSVLAEVSEADKA